LLKSKSKTVAKIYTKKEDTKSWWQYSNY